ncbi:YfjI family protein [Paracoccaceae bacterium]|nr:YfjI family protein [Paracoccaceae bacterium]
MSTLISKPVHVAVVDELGRQLKAASASGMQHKADALTSIMEAFGRTDGVMRQQGYATSTLKKSEAEKLEKVVICPSLTLVGMSTLSEFFKAIGGGDVASGLLNRFITVKSEIGVQMSQKRHVSKISEQLKAWAKEHAHTHVGDLDAGNIHDMPSNPLEVPFTPEAEELLFQYEARLVSAMEKEKGSGWEAMYNRSREIAMRLSLIIARSMEQDIIGLDAMQWSIDYVEHYATETIKLFKSHISDGPFQAVCNAVYAKIEAAGQTGVTPRELALSISTLANMDRRKRSDVLDALANDRGIECRNLNEGKRGRPKMAWLVPE